MRTPTIIYWCLVIAYAGWFPAQWKRMKVLWRWQENETSRETLLETTPQDVEIVLGRSLSPFIFYVVSYVILFVMSAQPGLRILLAAGAHVVMFGWLWVVLSGERNIDWILWHEPPPPDCADLVLLRWFYRHFSRKSRASRPPQNI